LPGDAWSDAYLAQTPDHAQLVLRMLKPEAAADPQRVERFLIGAKALSHLRHGAVVSVHDAGKTRDGRVYVLTDHVEGETRALRDRLVTLRGRKTTSSSDVHRTTLSKARPLEEEPVVESMQVDDPDLSGTALGNYAIEKVIGEGAMGRVYLARHTRIGRTSA